ncbi:hypothetical protein SMICM304S_07057 [Streptomyces microflavus]
MAKASPSSETHLPRAVRRNCAPRARTCRNDQFRLCVSGHPAAAKRHIRAIAVMANLFRAPGLASLAGLSVSPGRQPTGRMPPPWPRTGNPLTGNPSSARSPALLPAPPPPWRSPGPPPPPRPPGPAPHPPSPLPPPPRSGRRSTGSTTTPRSPRRSTTGRRRRKPPPPRPSTPWPTRPPAAPTASTPPATRSARWPPPSTAPAPWTPPYSWRSPRPRHLPERAAQLDRDRRARPVPAAPGPRWLRCSRSFARPFHLQLDLGAPAGHGTAAGQCRRCAASGR